MVEVFEVPEKEVEVVKPVMSREEKELQDRVTRELAESVVILDEDRSESYLARLEVESSMVSPSRKRFQD